MKRSALKRKPFVIPEDRRTHPLLRRSRLRSINPERLGRLREKQFGAQSEICRKSACLVGGCFRIPCDPHHVKKRGAGGLDCDTVPLCSGMGGHHEECEHLGNKAFQEKYGLDFEKAIDLFRRIAATRTDKTGGEQDAAGEGQEIPSEG